MSMSELETTFAKVLAVLKELFEDENMTSPLISSNADLCLDAAKSVLSRKPIPITLENILVDIIILSSSIKSRCEYYAP